MSIIKKNDLNIIIRLEEEKDYDEVENVTREAFWNNFQPGADEHYLLHVLRKHDDFISELDFVAVIDDKIVGHIAYTKAKIINDKTGIILDVISFGPISVLPEFQSKGIGSKLIKHSREIGRNLGYNAICIYGHPVYYGRVGFRCGEKYDITNEKGKYAVALMVYPLKDDVFTNNSGRYIESKIFAEFEEMLEKNQLENYDSKFPIKEKIENTRSQIQFGVLRTLQYKEVE